MTTPAPEQTPKWIRVHTVDEMQAFYEAMLPAVREAARQCGYALGLHGSLRRDLDLIAVPWIEAHSTPDALANAIMKAACGMTVATHQWERKPNGRIATSLPICWVEWNPKEKNVGHIDLSVLAALRASSQRNPNTAVVGDPKAWNGDEVVRVELVGERGNKAGTAQAGLVAPSSGSLPNTSGTVTPATPPAPGKKPLSQILEEARASDVYKAEAAALEAAAPAVPGTPQEVEALAKALEDIEHDTSCELNQRGSFIAIRVCDCTHPDRTKAATLLRTLSADLAALKADNTEQIRFKWELATDLAAAQQERDEALYRECDWERRARQAETDWAAMKDAFVAAEARAEKAERENAEWRLSRAKP